MTDPSDNAPPVSIGGDEEGEEKTEVKKPLPPVLPVLPLVDIVLFPGMIVPLLINSEGEKKLVDDVVAGTRYLLAVLRRPATTSNGAPEEREQEKAQESGEDDAAPQQALHEYGCLSRVLRMLKFPDDSVRVLVQGISRSKLYAFERYESYFRAHYQVLKDKEEQSIKLEALSRSAVEQFTNVISVSPALPDEMKLVLANMDDSGKLSDFIAANLNMPIEQRQEFLESNSPQARLEKLIPMLTHELEIIQVGSQIQTKVAEKLSKGQKDFFLREQLKAIRKELGEQDANEAQVNQLAERFQQADMPQEVKDVAAKEIERLGMIPSASPEHGVIRTYLDWLIELPWRAETQDILDIRKAQQILDNDHYDLIKVKDRVLEFLSVLKLKQDLKGPILCFVGPPGVGKTSLGQSIARALNRKFIRMSVGGMRDEAEIRGHRRTYIGAMPGRVIQSLRKAQSCNPVFMIDEVDKMGSDFRGDPASALLEVLDPEQNFSFADHYLDVAFDLSKVLFITTANQMEPIPPALRDRMEVLTLSGYTLEEKVQIGRRFLVPKQTAGHGLKRTQISVRKSALQRIVTNYTREAGVRNLEREVANVCRKVAREVAQGRRKKTVVRGADLHKLLGPPRFEAEKAAIRGQIGVATGLAWTPVGGQILFVEATRMPGGGKLILTGSLGDVMKESAQAAYSYIRSQGGKWGIPQDFNEKNDIHIHVPAGATPKDGPSAGISILMAMLSMLTQRPLKSKLAMTGEITLRGKVLPVGGVKEKVLAASRAGIRTVLLPQANRNDLEEIPQEIKERLTFQFVDKAGDAVQHALGNLA
ncbi:MAG: endopeptidase La [Kiritimatiellae bacterium]|nr:endopeptidase La [Kiritimatiellia bacterium]